MFLLGTKLDHTGDKTRLSLLRHCDEYLNISKDKHIYYSNAQLHLNVKNTIKFFQAPRLLADQMSGFSHAVQCYIFYQ